MYPTHLPNTPVDLFIALNLHENLQTFQWCYSCARNSASNASGNQRLGDGSPAQLSLHYLLACRQCSGWGWCLSLWFRHGWCVPKPTRLCSGSLQGVLRDALGVGNRSRLNLNGYWVLHRVLVYAMFAHTSASRAPLAVDPNRCVDPCHNQAMNDRQGLIHD